MALFEPSEGAFWKNISVRGWADDASGSVHTTPWVQVGWPGSSNVPSDASSLGKRLRLVGRSPPPPLLGVGVSPHARHPQMHRNVQHKQAMAPPSYLSSRCCLPRELSSFSWLQVQEGCFHCGVLGILQLRQR